MIESAARRWDCDERGSGVADGAALAAGVEELARLARTPGWVAEEPEVHLLPHLREAAVPGLTVLDWRVALDGVLEVDVGHPPEDKARTVRRRAWALIAAVAEPAGAVRERHDGEVVVFEVLTGVPPGDGPFASHGHTLRLRLRAAG